MLRAVSERDAYANLVLPAMLRERGITGRDAAFATELAYGTCRALGLLDAVIAACRGPAADRIDPGAARPAAARHLPVAAHPGRRARRRDHHRRAGRASNSTRHEQVSSTVCCAPSPARDEQSWIAELAPSAETDPIGHIAVRARPSTLDRPGVRRRARCGAGELDALLTPATTNGRWFISPPARRADRRSVARRPVDGTVGRYSPYAVYLPSGDPGQLDAVRRGDGARAGRGQPAGGAGADPRSRSTATAVAGWTYARGRGQDRAVGRHRAQAGARVTAVEPTPHRAEFVEQNTRGLRRRGAAGRRPRFRAASRLIRPRARRRAVHRPRGAAPTARGALASPARRRAGAGASCRRELLASAIALTRPGGVVLYATCSPHLAETVGVVADALRRHPVDGDRRPTAVRAGRRRSRRRSLRPALAASARHRCDVRRGAASSALTAMSGRYAAPPWPDR